MRNIVHPGLHISHPENIQNCEYLIGSLRLNYGEVEGEPVGFTRAERAGPLERRGGGNLAFRACGILAYSTLRGTTTLPREPRRLSRTTKWTLYSPGSRLSTLV